MVFLKCYLWFELSIDLFLQMFKAVFAAVTDKPDSFWIVPIYCSNL